MIGAGKSTMLAPTGDSSTNRCCKTMIRPSETMKPLIGESKVKRKTPRSNATPISPTATMAKSRPSQKLLLSWIVTNQARKPPMTKSSPWANMTSPVRPKMRVTPSAIKAITAPIDRPLTTCCRKISMSGLSSPDRPDRDRCATSDPALPPLRAEGEAIVTVPALEPPEPYCSDPSWLASTNSSVTPSASGPYSSSEKLVQVISPSWTRQVS